MKQLLSYAVLSVLCLTGCTNTSRQTVQELPRIQLNEDYPKKEIWLQDVADVEYIPLETNDKTLFNGSIIALSKEGILGMNRKEGRFFVFDGNGKSQSSFSRKGGGPEEYADLQQAVIDWKRKELYVLDPKSRICVYSPDGTFKRMLETKTIIRERDVCNYTDDLLMLFREIPEGGNAEKVAPYRPVLTLSKTDGKLDSLPYLKNQNRFITATLGEMKGFNFVPVLKDNGRETYLNDVASDTLFRMNKKKNEREPFLVRTPSVLDKDGEKYLLIVEGITPRYLFLKRQLTQVDLQKQNQRQENRSWVYDWQTGEIVQPIFKNKEYPSMEINNRNFEHSSGDKGDHLLLEASKLKEALANGELSGQLQKIAEGISEEDNPVLMVVKFKKP